MCLHTAAFGHLAPIPRSLRHKVHGSLREEMTTNGFGIPQAESRFSFYRSWTEVGIEGWSGSCRSALSCGTEAGLHLGDLVLENLTSKESSKVVFTCHHRRSSEF